MQSLKNLLFLKKLDSTDEIRISGNTFYVFELSIYICWIYLSKTLSLRGRNDLEMDSLEKWVGNCREKCLVFAVFLHFFLSILHKSHCKKDTHCSNLKIVLKEIVTAKLQFQWTLEGKNEPKTIETWPFLAIFYQSLDFILALDVNRF